MDPAAPPVPTRDARVFIPRLVLCVVLGFVTTVFMVVALTFWVPIKTAPARVATDGDHLNPWLLSLSRPGARRVIWFEKGRIWNHQQVGPRNGTGSSAAVACWSFATSTRGDPRTTHGPIDIPSEIIDATQCTPQIAWGGCVDYRGWPMGAASSCALGLMSQNATAPYRIDRGVPLAQDTTLGSRNSLADLEMVPWRPVWGGLLVDVAFYAALWWCVLLVPGIVAARRRLRKGACRACGYDMTGLEARICPECGAPAST